MHLLHFNDVLIRPLKDEGKTKEERQKKLQRILSLSSTLLLLMGVLSLSMGLSIRILSMRLREGDVTQIQKSLSVANPPFSPTGLSSPDDNATSSLRSVNDIQLTSAASASAKHKKGNSVASTLKSKSLLHKQKPQPKSAAAQHLTNALKNVRWSLKCSALGGFIACLVSMLEILVAVLALIVIFSGRRSVLIATGLMGFLLFNSDALLKGSENFIASCLEQTSLCTDSIRDKIDKQVNHIARLNGGLAGINLAALTIEVRHICS
ncbi:unnamed protein product [Cyprideis torosa]|uniref:Uncharacterized protein n=1 Tax=Cyprideis torosa TaxID=163714 RepID=A0A7R8W0M9_9CRUS|nr:unnamed protein product [Cyprideis torosa]CAG0879924.1 unnamed protein product [Cyprideis torosa]